MPMLASRAIIAMMASQGDIAMSSNITDIDRLGIYIGFPLDRIPVLQGQLVCDIP